MRGRIRRIEDRIVFITRDSVEARVRLDRVVGEAARVHHGVDRDIFRVVVRDGAMNRQLVGTNRTQEDRFLHVEHALDQNAAVCIQVRVDGRIGLLESLKGSFVGEGRELQVRLENRHLGCSRLELLNSRVHCDQ